MSIPAILHVADSKSTGCGATVRFENGDRCTISVARTSVIVKKSRTGFFGSVLYKEENVYKSAQTAMALACLYRDRRFPEGISSPILKSYLNALLHCDSVVDVSIRLNQSVWAAEKQLGRPLQDVYPSDLPDWAIDHGHEPPASGRTQTNPIEELGTLLETYPDAILDTSMLPLPKTQMKIALKQLWFKANDREVRNHLEYCYMMLANFQDSVGPTPCKAVDPYNIKPDLVTAWLKSDDGKATMAAFKNFAKWQGLAANESGILLDELNQWKGVQKQR